MRTISEGFIAEVQLLDNTDNNAHNISDKLFNFAIKDRFLENSFPLVLMDFKFEQTFAENIGTHDVEFAVKISRYTEEAVSGTDEEENTEIFPDEILFETIIRPYTKPTIQSDIKNDTDDDDSESSNPANSVPIVIYTINGIPKELIKKNKKVINRVFSNSTLNDVVVNILTEIDGSEKYIENSNNNQKYHSIIVPPMNPIPAMRFLQDQYKIYEKGLITYFGIEKTYFCSAFAERESYRNNFNIRVMSSNDTSDALLYSNAQIDESGTNIQIFLRQSPMFSSRKEIVSDSVGKETVIYSYDDNFNLVSNQTTNALDFEKVRYFWSSKGNNLEESEYLESAKKHAVTTIQVNSISPFYFTPETFFSIAESPNPEINGTYFMTERVFKIYSIDGEKMKGSTSIALIKK